MTRNPGRRIFWKPTTLVVLVGFVVGTEVWAQAPRPIRVPAIRPQILAAPTASGEDEAADSVFLSADRRTLQKLADAKTLAAEKRFSEAVRCLGDILEQREDYFFQPDPKSPIYRSLKGEAQRLIGEMPHEARELYELQYGPRAKHLLDAALESGTASPLAEVSRQFFHTQAGYQATFLLGLDHFDHGRPLAGALTLQRLHDAGSVVEDLEPGLSLTLAACWLQAGMQEKAQQCLVSLRERHPKLHVTVAGHEVPIFSDNSAAISWLDGLMGAAALARSSDGDHWWMLRGNPSRTASMTGGMPLMNLRWRVPASLDPETEDALDQFRQQYLEERSPVIPALHPLFVGDVLLMRTARNLLAVDVSSGKRLWEAPTDDDEVAAPASGDDARMQRALFYGGVAEQSMYDLTYGAISSDGRRVFAVEDLELSFGTVGTAIFRIGRAFARNPGILGTVGDQETIDNRLAAYDIRTGKLAWNLGGPVGPRALRQAETFFLGAPLPLMDQLYVMAETKGEIRLMAIDPASGDVAWSQQVAVVEQGVAQNPVRRTAGVTPSYGDGILVCPTAAGAIVGVDLATRSLLWGYRYGQGRKQTPLNPMAIAARGRGQPASSSWIDGSVAIVEGRVLATPNESDALYCLSLADGKEIWQSPRRDDLFVGCVDRDKVVLVGTHAVRSLRTSDGSPLWKGRTAELPDDAMPSGRGFRTGSRYYLPLSTAEVIAIDLDSGKIVGRAKSRNHLVPGNLVCYRDKLLSQGIGGIEMYDQIDAVRGEVQRRLADNPKDAGALSLQGELLLEEGKRSEAVASLRRANALQPDPQTRTMLLDALLDGMRLEFAAYKPSGDEIEGLVEDSARRVLYYRLMADGLRQEGQWERALKYYEKAVDFEPNQQALDRLDDHWTARRDRWVQSRLMLLRDEAKGDAAATIDARVRSRATAAMADGSIDALQRFVGVFGDWPPAAAARKDLVRQLREKGRSLQAELMASDDAVGQQVTTSVSESWPVGKVDAKVRSANPSMNGLIRNAIEISGDPGPYLADVSLYLDPNRRMLCANDGWGRELWQATVEPANRSAPLTMNRAWTYAQGEKHLLLVTLGWKVLAFDTTDADMKRAPRLLWTESLMGSNDDPVEAQAAMAWPMQNFPWRQSTAGRGSGRLNLLGPVTNRYVCIQKMRSLDVLDPWSGATLWSRDDVSPGSTVFGDNEFLFVLSSDREDATLLRAVDGEIVGTCKVPRPGGRQPLPGGKDKFIYAPTEEYCLATLGRQMLLWWPEDGQQRLLTMVDPFEGRDVWPGRMFPNNAHTSVADDRVVGVMQLDGHFVMMRLADGRTLADLTLEPEPTLIDITLMANGNRYYLLTRSASPHSDSPLHAPQIPGCNPNPIEQGRLYAFDADGKTLWKRPATIERQFILQNQPWQLPVLCFASQVYEQSQDGNTLQVLSLMVIDKRNGRVAYKDALTNNMGLVEVSGDPKKKTVDLTTQREVVQLTFTDQPLPPMKDDEYRPTRLPKERDTSSGFWKSLQKTVEKALDELGKGGR